MAENELVSATQAVKHKVRAKITHCLVIIPTKRESQRWSEEKIPKHPAKNWRNPGKKKKLWSYLVPVNGGWIVMRKVMHIMTMVVGSFESSMFMSSKRGCKESRSTLPTKSQTDRGLFGSLEIVWKIPGTQVLKSSILF